MNTSTQANLEQREGGAPQPRHYAGPHARAHRRDLEVLIKIMQLEIVLSIENRGDIEPG
jgi:hypothetical protein